MPLLETKGAASAQGFGLTLQQAAANYIEDVFSTYLYTGNGSSSRAIDNGIDLSTKGGLVWTKQRSGVEWHFLVDTARGATNCLSSNSPNASASYAQTLTAFNTTGYSIGNDSGFNSNGSTYASWTFRKQPKFFDVVTFTTNGSGNATVSHALGSTPGCIFIKSTTNGTTSDGRWYVYHRMANGGSSPGNYYLILNTTDVTNNAGATWITPSATDFQISGAAGVLLASTAYVAYVFAHDAGGFGLTGTDNVISCGSYTGNGSATGPTITLGYEPQWVMIKSASSIGNWVMQDVMRGMPVGSSTMTLWANLSNAESDPGISRVQPTATGFQLANTASADLNANGQTYIYIAIRRGPMKTPTTGTSVFNPVARTGTGTNPTVVTTTNNPDLLMSFPRTASPAAYGMLFWDKLRGISPMLQSATTGAEISTNTTRVLQGWRNTGYQAGADFIEGYLNYSGSDYVNYPITRAPGFFDVVCYTGTGVNRTVTHNLGVAPELMIIKSRSSGSYGWPVYAAAPGPTQFAYLDLTAGFSTNSTAWNDTAPTASVFTVGTGPLMNASGVTFVAYLFASCPGVSKVGSYTGTGALQTINCGFTGGARFVLIKRTDASGYGWFTYDSARGITSGNDPYLLMNSTAAEVTGTNYVDTTSVGFQVTAAAPADLNASGGTYIFLAIA